MLITQAVALQELPDQNFHYIFLSIILPTKSAHRRLKFALW